MTDDRNLPVTRAVTSLPVISAEAYQYVGRYAGAIVMSVFEQIGGVERMAAWAETSPESFYTKVFPKMISRSQQVEHSGSVTIDDAITRLERIEEAEFMEVAQQEYDL
jgi:hypothetical protein